MQLHLRAESMNPAEIVVVRREVVERPGSGTAAIVPANRTAHHVESLFKVDKVVVLDRDPVDRDVELYAGAIASVVVACTVHHISRRQTGTGIAELVVGDGGVG